MGKAINCPDFNDTEFKLLLKEMPKAETANADAYNIWLNNGGKYPDHIIEKANPVADLTEKESVLDDKQILNKQRVIEKSIDVITKKVGRLVNQDVKEEYINEYIKLLSDLKNFEADAAIIEFIKASDRITRSALKTIDEIEESIKDNKNIVYSMKGLYNIKTYVGVFDLLKDIRKESIEDPQFEEHIPLLQTILDRQNDILTKVKDLSNGIISKDLAANCDIIEKKYKREAEKNFEAVNKNKDLKGKEKEIAKKDYIDNYIYDNKGKILAETRDFTNGLLLRTEDIPYMSSLLTNPKDINNYILAYAVELLDKADFNVNQRLAIQAKTFASLHKEYTKFIGNKSNMEELYEPLLEKVNGKLTGYLVNPGSGNQFKDLNTKYKDTIVKQLYDELVKLNEEKDKSVTMKSKLGYRLPSINKSFMERIYSENILSSSKDALFDKFRLTSSDTDLGDIDKRLENQKISKDIEVLTNEFGEEKQNVPLHYRGKFDPKSQSYDLLTLAMLDLSNTRNFEEKASVGIVLNLLKENIAEADIIQRDFRGFLKIDKNTKSTVIKKGIDSNLYKNLEDIIRHRVYGISVEGNPQTIKVINTMKSFVGTLNLSLNYLSAGANLSQGLVMEWIESVGGKSGAYGRKNRANAYLKYNKDLVNMTKDIGEFTPTSKTNLLAEKLQIHRLWSAHDQKFIENSIAKKVGVGGTLRFMDEIGDNHLQSILMYAILDNIKVFDKDGNYLDKEFKPTKDRDKAISYDEAHTVVDGKLVLNKAVTNTERTSSVNEDLKLSKYIKKVSRELFGNYDPNNKAIAQRTIIGHLIFQMRGWLVPGFEKRWKGISKVGIKSEDLTLAQLDYSTESGKFEEGNYTTAIRFITTIAKELKSLKTLTVQDNWKKLTDNEKGNINKTLLEGALIGAFLMIAISLRNSMDDDKEKDFGTLLATYYSRRLFSELFTYANPKEGLRTFKSPAVVLGTVEDIIDLLEQSIDPTEEYTTGKRKGDLKIAKRIKDLTPIYKQYDKDIQTSLFFLEK